MIVSKDIVIRMPLDAGSIQAGTKLQKTYSTVVSKGQ
jgi:hypothetical protein